MIIDTFFDAFMFNALWSWRFELFLDSVYEILKVLH